MRFTESEGMAYRVFDRLEVLHDPDSSRLLTALNESSQVRVQRTVKSFDGHISETFLAIIKSSQGDATVGAFRGWAENEDVDLVEPVVLVMTDAGTSYNTVSKTSIVPEVAVILDELFTQWAGDTHDQPQPESQVEELKRAS